MGDVVKELLPPSWQWTTIGDIAEVNPGKSTLKSLPDDLGVTFVPMSSVDEISGSITDPQTRQLGQVRRGYTYFGEGDVLLAKITPCMENGKAAIARGLQNRLGFGSTEFHVMRPKSIALDKWIYYFVRQQSFRNAAKANFSGTAGQLRVPSDFVSTSSIPLPPLPEQHRIVAKIEELLTRLDAGVAALKRAQANLKRYKASVLKAACKGRLVPQDPNDEPAEVLLQRILMERRAKWAGKGKYVEPQPPDTKGLPTLPKGWCWATVEQACDHIADCLHSTPMFVETGYYCLDTNWIKPSQIVFDKARYVDAETFIERNRRLKPTKDDVVFSREGALLGVAVKLPENFDCCLGQRMMVFRLGSFIQSSYFETILNSPFFRSQYVPLIGGTASPHLNIKDIRRFVLPIPPLSEQTRIVAEIERRLSMIDRHENTLTTSLTRAERMRQSILRRAFRGDLLA